MDEKGHVMFNAMCNTKRALQLHEFKTKSFCTLYQVPLVEKKTPNPPMLIIFYH